MEKTIDLGLNLPDNAALDWRTVLDAERLLRLHPHWHVEVLEGNHDHVRARLKDHATDEVFDFGFGLVFAGPHEFVITPAEGPVTAMRFFTRNDRIHVGVATAADWLAEKEEQNLTLWLQSIRQYLRLYLTTTPYTLFFRWLMNSALLHMNPSQRKICLMIYRFTVLEVVVILIILIGYFTLGR